MISGAENGMFNLLWYETFWSVCYGRRGIMEGTGQLVAGSKDILVMDIVISCFDPDADVVEHTMTFELAAKDMYS